MAMNRYYVTKRSSQWLNITERGLFCLANQPWVYEAYTISIVDLFIEKRLCGRNGISGTIDDTQCSAILRCCVGSLKLLHYWCRYKYIYKITAQLNCSVWPFRLSDINLLCYFGYKFGSSVWIRLAYSTE